ncbi:hypothetical protein H7992_22075 [Sporosarcina sp. resist]|uniref:hypothetical protein n=1 Tax=Sporosarcina sp. resist TaxID=2762563 RepID=UPI00164DC9E7|nr:hypothetical protein [Sporosarcina sp. resist]QNK87819.1 hypothetical protein H7992_22075 [Sporosarcina sp. resist]
MAYYKDLKNGSYRLFVEAGKDLNGERDRRSKVVWPSGPRELKRMMLELNRGFGHAGCCIEENEF